MPDLSLKGKHVTDKDKEEWQTHKNKQMWVTTDNDCSSSYWLRIPAERTEKRPNTYHEQLTVHQRNPTQEPVKDRGDEHSAVPTPARKETHIAPEYLPNPILVSGENGPERENLLKLRSLWERKPERDKTLMKTHLSSPDLRKKLKTMSTLILTQKLDPWPHL